MLFNRRLFAILGITCLLTASLLFAQEGPSVNLSGTEQDSSLVKDTDWGELVIDEETRKMCNNAMVNIYGEILKAKSQYKELADFDENVFYENKRGLYAIVYQHGEDSPDEKDKRKTPYAFGITIDALKDKTFKDREGSFSYGFPVLGLKFNGFKKKHLLRSQYDILPLIQKYGVAIAWHEQKYLPLRLYLKTVKDTYRVRENVEFEAVLKNVSLRHMQVKNLGAETLFFLFNDAEWGTRVLKKSAGGETVILKAGESLAMKFKGESFQKQQKFEIKAIYGMRIKGVNPMGILEVKVVEGESQEGGDE